MSRPREDQARNRMDEPRNREDVACDREGEARGRAGQMPEFSGSYLLPPEVKPWLLYLAE